MFEAIKKFFTSKGEQLNESVQQTATIPPEAPPLKKERVPKIKRIKKTFVSETEAICNK